MKTFEELKSNNTKIVSIHDDFITLQEKLGKELENNIIELLRAIPEHKLNLLNEDLFVSVNPLDEENMVEGIELDESNQLHIYTECNEDYSAEDLDVNTLYFINEIIYEYIFD